jgi:hypothetical protein
MHRYNLQIGKLIIELENHELTNLKPRVRVQNAKPPWDHVHVSLIIYAQPTNLYLDSGEVRSA